jgi:membrane protein
MKLKSNFNNILKKFKIIIGNTITGFTNDKGMKLSAALAYNTLFSLGPMFFLIIFITGNLFSQQAIEGQIYNSLKDIMGSATAEQIQQIVLGLQKTESNFLARLISIIALVFGATGVFTEIQDSLNFIWGVKVKKRKGFIKLLLTRVLSFSMIIGLGFLMIASLLASTIINAISENFFELLKLNDIIPEVSKGMLLLINNIVVFLVLSLLFTLIFKILPDVKIKTREVWPGSFLTTLLFMLGKYLIGIYISSNKMVSLYGATSSVIILLIWIYFSAVILYIGAEFTRSYIEYKNGTITPNKFAEYDIKRILEQYTNADLKDDGKINLSNTLAQKIQKAQEHNAQHENDI